jgi:hypothetical protein
MIEFRTIYNINIDLYEKKTYNLHVIFLLDSNIERYIYESLDVMSRF